MSKKTRASRWDTTRPFDLSAAPFGWTEEGYRDFRGAPINRYTKVVGRHFMKCDLSEADFSGVELKKLEFVDCRFTATNFASIHDRSNQFTGCVFKKCVFREAFLGMRPPWRAGPSRYEDCVFEGCDFTRSLFRNAIFRRTVFDGNRTKGVDFSASGFWDCRFVGLVQDVWFRGGYPHSDNYKTFGIPRESGLHRVDFSDAKLVELTISDGCTLEGILLPADGSCALINIEKWISEAQQFSGAFGDDSELIESLVDLFAARANPNGISTPQTVDIQCRHNFRIFLEGFTERASELADQVFDRIRQHYSV